LPGSETDYFLLCASNRDERECRSTKQTAKFKTKTLPADLRDLTTFNVSPPNRRTIDRLVPGLEAYVRSPLCEVLAAAASPPFQALDPSKAIQIAK
jgi:hypothetical protein